MAVRTGLEVLAAQQGATLRGRRVGLVCNQASVGPGFEHAADLVARQRLVRLCALFGPEHGVRGEAQDMIPVAGGGAADEELGVPVHSLYGDSLESCSPADEMLDGLDVLVVDLQDVGVRWYTFASTMVLAMRAARRNDVSVVVLDRPDPLGGEAVEGGAQEEGYYSFCGLFPLPVRHGLTMGEIALYANEKLGVDCDLAVVAMDGWKRSMLWEETGLPFVPPSPNMPTPDTARVYGGTCLVEATNLSEGRGTTRPFEQIGAPFLDPYDLAERMNAQGLPGVRFRPCRFRPVFHKHAGKSCGGVFLHVTDARTFLPYKTGLSLLLTARDLAPGDFRWRTERYEFVDEVPAIDVLAGTDQVRKAFDHGDPIGYLMDAWRAQEAAFLEARRPFLLYE